LGSGGKNMTMEEDLIEEEIRNFYNSYRYDRELTLCPEDYVMSHEAFIKSRSEPFHSINESTLPYSSDQRVEYEERAERFSVARNQVNRSAQIHILIDLSNLGAGPAREWVFHNAGRFLADEEFSEIANSLERNHKINSNDIPDAHTKILSEGSYPNTLIANPKAISELTQKRDIVPDWKRSVDPKDRTLHFRGYYRGKIRTYQSYKLDSLYMYEKENVGYERTDFDFSFQTGEGDGERYLLIKFFCACRPFEGNQVAKIAL
jgi:hypothetical protein